MYVDLVDKFLATTYQNLEENWSIFAEIQSFSVNMLTS